MKDILQTNGGVLSNRVSGMVDSCVTTGSWCPYCTALAIPMCLYTIV